MTRVSMTWPQFFRHEVTVDGAAVRMEALPHALAALLLLRPPDRFVGYAQIVEWLWPNPDTQPLDTHGIISVTLHRLRRAGVPVENDWGIGLRIPALARGGKRQASGHALDRRGPPRARPLRFALEAVAA